MLFSQVKEKTLFERFIFVRSQILEFGAIRTEMNTSTVGNRLFKRGDIYLITYYDISSKEVPLAETTAGQNICQVLTQFSKALVTHVTSSFELTFE
jgi:hypothetical protein